MADFRLPISDTSTHKSVNPHSLVFTNTSNGTVTYDGSIATTINLSTLIVSQAAKLVGETAFTVNLNGAAATMYDGSQNAANVAISGILGTAHGGTGLSSLGNAGTVLGIATASNNNKVLGYQSITLTTGTNSGTDGQTIGIKVGNTAVSSISLDIASTTDSGIVTTAAQTFAGAKTFQSVHSPLFCVEDSSNVHKVQLEYNSTTKALDFNFV